MIRTPGHLFLATNTEKCWPHHTAMVTNNSAISSSNLKLPNCWMRDGSYRIVRIKMGLCDCEDTDGSIVKVHVVLHSLHDIHELQCQLEVAFL